MKHNVKQILLLLPAIISAEQNYKNNVQIKIKSNQINLYYP